MRFWSREAEVIWGRWLGQKFSWWSPLGMDVTIPWRISYRMETKLCKSIRSRFWGNQTILIQIFLTERRFHSGVISIFYCVNSIQFFVFSDWNWQLFHLSDINTIETNETRSVCNRTDGKLFVDALGQWCGKLSKTFRDQVFLNFGEAQNDARIVDNIKQLRQNWSLTKSDVSAQLVGRTFQL